MSATPIGRNVDTLEKMKTAWALLSQQWRDDTPANLTQTISNPPTTAEVTAIQTKLNALLSQQRQLGGGS